jgi:chromosome segregation ATPase
MKKTLDHLTIGVFAKAAGVNVESQAVITQWATRTETLEATVDRLQLERDSDAEHREKLGAALTDSEKHLAACQQRISDLRERVAAADDRNQFLNDQNRELLQEKAVLQGQLKQLQTSLAK